MTTQREYYELIGILATRFSNLQNRATCILECLIDHQDSLVGGLVATDMTFFNCIKLIKKVSGARFKHNQFLCSSLQSYCKSLDDIRDQRNLFVHGQWDMPSGSSDSPIIVCQDMTWVKHPSKQQWSRKRQQVWDADSFKSKIVEVDSLLNLTRETFRMVKDYLTAQQATP